MTITQGNCPDIIPEVNVDIKFACGNANGGLSPVTTSWLDNNIVVPTTTITPTIPAIAKYFCISFLLPPIMYVTFCD